MLQMRLTKKNLELISSKINKPILLGNQLPEKVLQFGTGVLLRALPDYFINKANQEGKFLGSILVVKSTGNQLEDAFSNQNNLYTLCIRGTENEKEVSENIISSSISRVLHANISWPEILASAHSPAMQIIISNTTETGINYTPESIFQFPPSTFPAKLLSFLYERYKAFSGTINSGMLIIPTELIPDNGDRLKSIILQLIEYNNLGDIFAGWVSYHNTFCNSLVDRIVPGKPHEVLNDIQADLGYEDELLCLTEPYNLWAIEGNEVVERKLEFHQSAKGIVITHDIAHYRELKLRLLNGSHTLSCGPAFLLGINTVKDAMLDPLLSSYISTLLFGELAKAIPYTVPINEAIEYSKSVLDRFRNPYLAHHWLAITNQYTSKLKIRVLPVLLHFYKVFNYTPSFISFGFAAWIRFMKSKPEGSIFQGEFNGNNYIITDDYAQLLSEKWASSNGYAVVKDVLSDIQLWNTDLNQLPGFCKSVQGYLETIQQKGISIALHDLCIENSISF